MSNASLSADDVSRFDELSRWAESWLKDELPRYAGINPQTGAVRNLMLIEERLRENPDAWLRELGSRGPVFCDWCYRLKSVLASSGSFAARLGFIADVSATDRTAETESHLSGHAAAGHWINAVGSLMFGLEPWRHAVENGSGFPTDRRYLDVVNQWWQQVSESSVGQPAGDDDNLSLDAILALEDVVDTEEVTTNCTRTRWTIRDTAMALQRVCWSMPDAWQLWERMGIERGLLKPPPAKVKSKNYLGLNLELSTMALSRDGYQATALFFGKPEQWAVIQRLVANQQAGLTKMQRDEIDNKSANTWSKLKIALNNSLAPLELRISARDWRLEEISDQQSRTHDM